jgi:cell wall-associated protease
MKKIIITSCFLFAITSYCNSQQFYFPRTLYSDSAAFSRAMPGLAKQVSDHFTNKDNPVYYYFMPRFQMLAGNYDSAIQCIADYRKRQPWLGDALDFKDDIYARVKLEQKTAQQSFDKLYKREFMVRYSRIPVREQYLALATFTTNINQYAEKLDYLKNLLKRKNTDSVSFGNAQALCFATYLLKVSSEVLPSATPWLTRLENKNFVLHADRQNWLALNPLKRQYDWWLADWKKDSLPGISLNEAYHYLEGRTAQPVVVAILDGGLDTAHEDLKDCIWVNTKEISGNGIDDDGNGYIDDVHGWNFVANMDSKFETKMNYTALYRLWNKKFENIDPGKLHGADKAQYDMYRTDKKDLFEEYQYIQLAKLLSVDISHSVIDSARFIKYLDNVLTKYSRYKDSLVTEPIPFSSFSFPDRFDSTANAFFPIYIKNNKQRITLESFIYDTKSKINAAFFNKYVFADETQYDTTSHFENIVGDDPNDFTDFHYGSPYINVAGISSDHATLISGIIAANRRNGIGINGIADKALIMELVTNTNHTAGWIKDVIAAIHYAVDNGAFIINMSFNGTPSTNEHEKELREAIDYAWQHNVLIVNSAGNEGVTMDKEIHLLGQGINGKEHDNYIRVGATTALLNDGLVASFSNFGGKSVDIFAPGEGIYSTMPGNRYKSEGGTSLSGPMVVGVAALLKSYFPTLTAKQIKEIIMKSVYKPDLMVIPPIGAGYHHKIRFTGMSKSGGIVNAYNAVKLADEMTKKNKRL